MVPGARFARGARALLCSGLCVVGQGCDGDLVNLGRSEGLTGGAAGAGASAGVGAAASDGGKTWQLQDEPIVGQMQDILLANPTLTREMDLLYFTLQPRYGDDTRTGLRRATLAGTTYTNVTPLELGSLTQLDVASPAISADGSELWLGLAMAEGLGGTDIWLSQKEGERFTTPELVAELSSAFDDAPRPPAAGGTLMSLSSKRHGGRYYQIYLAARADASAPWSEPTQALLASVNGADFQSVDGFLADAGRALYFASNRDGQQSDLYVARRGSPTEPFGEPQLVPDLNSPSSEERMPWLSEDEKQLFFASNRSGQYALYRAQR